MMSEGAHHTVGKTYLSPEADAAPKVLVLRCGKPVKLKDTVGNTLGTVVLNENGTVILTRK